MSGVLDPDLHNKSLQRPHRYCKSLQKVGQEDRGMLLSMSLTMEQSQVKPTSGAKGLEFFGKWQQHHACPTTVSCAHSSCIKKQERCSPVHHLPKIESTLSGFPGGEKLKPIVKYFCVCVFVCERGLFLFQNNVFKVLQEHGVLRMQFQCVLTLPHTQYVVLNFVLIPTLCEEICFPLSHLTLAIL